MAPISLTPQQLEALFDTIGLLRIDQERFRHSGFIDFDRCSPDSQLGLYIDKVKREAGRL
jgi:hypothetical protein